VQKKVERGGCGDFCEIWAFLRGVLEKVGGWTWFFVVKTWWDAW
jgi:hypothetical protein